ncbi:MAG TPA: hypothetical protein VNH83_00050 [Bryobacteraceae bacterium]|nr:hypothetical protein [Bryobacteraceae bacterium]
MSLAARAYAYGVIAIGGLILVASLQSWSAGNLVSFAIYFALSVAASMLKFKLPGIEGTYSVSFLFTLIGIAEFTLPETLIATCLGAVIQCLWKAKNRPTLVQILFSMANLCISTGLCFVIVHRVLAGGLQAYRPAVLALAAAIHFATSTILVSGVLSLLNGQRLRDVYQKWYFWSFPYYLVGAAVVGLLPFSGRVAAPEGWLVLLPLLYLVHFYYILSSGRSPSTASGDGEPVTELPARANIYIYTIIAAGSGLLIYAALHWQSQSVAQFLGYLVMALLAGTCKVRLPRLTSTISISFVLILVAIAELSYAEAIWLSASVAVVQTMWRAKRPFKPIRIAFNTANLVLSTSTAFFVCRTLLDLAPSGLLPVLLILATAILYASNSAMVAAVLCLAEDKPMRDLWQQCYFWSFPYYLAGAAVSGLMIATARGAGWPFSFLVLPILTMIYVSYRLHTHAKLEVTCM